MVQNVMELNQEYDSLYYCSGLPASCFSFYTFGWWLQGGAIMPRMKVMGPKGEEWKQGGRSKRTEQDRERRRGRVVNERKREIKSGPLIFLEEISRKST
jgi:hypothetical protein